jgi:hypothetical protein
MCNFGPDKYKSMNKQKGQHKEFRKNFSWDVTKDLITLYN